MAGGGGGGGGRWVGKGWVGSLPGGGGGLGGNGGVGAGTGQNVVMHNQSTGK